MVRNNVTTVIREEPASRIGVFRAPHNRLSCFPSWDPRNLATMATTPMKNRILKARRTYRYARFLVSSWILSGRRITRRTRRRSSLYSTTSPAMGRTT